MPSGQPAQLVDVPSLYWPAGHASQAPQSEQLVSQPLSQPSQPQNDAVSQLSSQLPLQDEPL